MLISATAAALAACTGSVTSGEFCLPIVGNAAPDTPSMVAPLARSIVGVEQLVLTGSPFADADADDGHFESEVEIWSFVDGAPVGLVWHAKLLDPTRLTTATLADGFYEGAPAVTALAPWQDYGARIRYRDDSRACSGWSEYSEYGEFRTDDGSEYLFDPDRIHDVYVDLSPESWDAINNEALPPDCVPYQRVYHPGTVRFEDQVFEGAGVRAKGGCGSARNLTEKAGLKINLSWDDPNIEGCPAEQRLFAKQRLTINNMVQDQSFVHERLAYEFHHAMGVPTPRAAHVRLFINNELYGLYVHVESIDRRFLRRWFDSNQGMLYEGTYWCDLIDENVPATLDDSGCMSRKFTGGPCATTDPGADPTDYTKLRELVDAIAALPEGGFFPEVQSFFDFDTLLSSWAVHAVIAHWDSYEFEIINNYRVYHDPATDRWTIIPTGLDQTFRDELDIWEAQGLLAQRCLSEPDCEAAYAARVYQALEIFEQFDLAGYSQRIQTQISDYVAEDPRKEGGFDTFVSENQDVRQWIAERPALVRQMLAARGY